MALAHTKTELRAFSKDSLIAALLELEAKHTAAELRIGALENLHHFPEETLPYADPRRRAERFMLATGRYIAYSMKNADTTIPAVSRWVINSIREAMRQYEEALAEAADTPAAGSAQEQIGGADVGR